MARWLGLSEPLNAGRSAGLGLAVFPEGHGLNKEVRLFVDAGMRAGYVPLNDKEIYWFLVCNCSAEGWHFVTEKIIKTPSFSKSTKILVECVHYICRVI